MIKANDVMPKLPDHKLYPSARLPRDLMLRPRQLGFAYFGSVEYYFLYSGHSGENVAGRAIMQPNAGWIFMERPVRGLRIMSWHMLDDDFKQVLFNDEFRITDAGLAELMRMISTALNVRERALCWRSLIFPLYQMLITRPGWGYGRDGYELGEWDRMLLEEICRVLHIRVEHNGEYMMLIDNLRVLYSPRPMLGPVNFPVGFEAQTDN